MENSLRNQVFSRDGFTCQKCNFIDLSASDLEAHHITPKVFGGLDILDNLVTLCSICHNYAPDSEKLFLKYLDEKIDGTILNTFRYSQYSISRKTKTGMKSSFAKGKHITKAPKGYKIINKMLIPDENSNEIKQIFQEFLDSDISLTQLAKKSNMTPTGMKKLLRNTTYLGKVRFDNKESEGQHEAILDQQLFRQVQQKIKQLGWS